MRKAKLLVFGMLLATLFLTAGTLSPQDIVKVSPETHVVLLENPQVRVLAVRVKPGEKVGMHSHPHNVVYYLTDGKLRLTSANGKIADREVKAGTAIWSEASTHSAENIGTTEFREVQIELKQREK